MSEMTPEMRREIRKEVAKQVYVILAGMVGTNTNQTEDILSTYPGAPPIPSRPVMHPYGIVSRAPTGTIQVVSRVGEHPGAKMVMGHRDANRPNVNQGETQLYNQFGQAIYLKNGEVCIGIAEANDPVLLGNENVAFFKNFMTLFMNHTHIGNLGAPTPLATSDQSTAEQYLSSPIGDNSLVSSYIFTDSKAGG